MLHVAQAKTKETTVSNMFVTSPSHTRWLLIIVRLCLDLSLSFICKLLADSEWHHFHSIAAVQWILFLVTEIPISIIIAIAPEAKQQQATQTLTPNPFDCFKTQYPKRVHVLGKIRAGPIMTVCQGTRGQTNFGECVFYLALEHAYKRNSSFLLNYALAGAQTKTHMNII